MIELRPDGAAPISAVIPAFDSEDFIADAVRSVQEQTIPVAEILVVDDGSADRTAEIATSLGARVLSQENRGVSAARNAGIRSAACAWIALLDADDMWEPDKIRWQLRALELDPGADAVFTDRTHFDGSGVLEEAVLMARDNYRSVRRTRLGESVVACEPESLARSLFPGNFIPPSSLLARKDTLLEAGLFDTGIGRPGSMIGQVEDRDFSLRLVKRARVLAVERPLVRYRIHPGGASRERLRVQLGAAEIAERVFERPDRYPEGAIEYFRKDQPRRLREAGIMLMERGRFPEARSVLWRSLRSGPSLRTAAAFAVSVGGGPVYGALVRLKRSFDLPGIRRAP